MLLGIFSVSPAELMILLIVGALLLLPLIIAGIVLLVILAKRSKAGAGPWAAEPSGQPMRIRLLGPSDKPNTDSVRWNGNELEVRANEAGTIHLFDVNLDNLDQCMITYRFRIKTDNLPNAVYPELW